ncbi:MAG: MopE-related protein [bacterium]
MVCAAAAGEGAVEVRNGVDDDCDGEVDEPVPCYPGPRGRRVGACRGASTCDGGLRGRWVRGRGLQRGGRLRRRGGRGRPVPVRRGAGALLAGLGARCRDLSSGNEACGANHQFGACQGQEGVETCDGRDEDWRWRGGRAARSDCGSDVGRCQAGIQRCGRPPRGPARARADAAQRPATAPDDDRDGRTDEDVSRGAAATSAAAGPGSRPARAGPSGVPGPGAGGRAATGPTTTATGAPTRAPRTCGGAGVPDEQCNGADDDCDGRVDEAVQNACGGCGGVPDEQCNGADDDCDGRVDEGTLNACGQCGEVPAETCNGVDDDCDGSTDEALVQGCGVDRGVCTVGEQVCRDGAFGACSGVGPSAEDCNNADDDCDGAVDEGDFFELGCDFRADTCRAGQCVCGNGSRCPISRECINGRCVIIQ